MALAAWIVDRAGWNYAVGADISSSQENTDYPLTNLTDQQANNPAKFSATTFSVDFDLSTAEEVTLFSILGHNFQSDATITLYNADNASFTSPNSQVLTWTKESIHTILSADNDNRYWRLTVVDSSNPGLPMIGEIVMGQYVSFTTQQMSWGLVNNRTSRVGKNKTKFAMVHRYLYNVQQNLNNINFREISDTTRAEIIEMFEAANGSEYPIIFLWNIDNAIEKSIYGKLQNSFNIINQFINIYNIKSIAITGLPYSKELYQ